MKHVLYLIDCSVGSLELSVLPMLIRNEGLVIIIAGFALFYKNNHETRHRSCKLLKKTNLSGFLKAGKIDGLMDDSTSGFHKISAKERKKILSRFKIEVVEL